MCWLGWGRRRGRVYPVSARRKHGVSKLFFPPIHPAHFTSTAGVEAGMGQYCAIAEKVLKKPTTTNSAMVRITLTLSPLSSDDGDERPSFFDSNWSGQPT